MFEFSFSFRNVNYLNNLLRIVELIVKYMYIPYCLSPNHYRSPVALLYISYRICCTTNDCASTFNGQLPVDCWVSSVSQLADVVSIWLYINVSVYKLDHDIGYGLAPLLLCSKRMPNIQMHLCIYRVMHYQRKLNQYPIRQLTLICRTTLTANVRRLVDIDANPPLYCVTGNCNRQSIFLYPATARYFRKLL